MTDSESPSTVNPDLRRETVGLMLLFGAMYFVQGIAEPTEGLIAQPVRSLLKSWGRSASEIGTFMAILSLPWTFKPFYGLLTDFVPLAGTRRRSYLLLSTLLTVLGLGYLYFHPPSRGTEGVLLVLLLGPTLGVAFSDVVVDALMVEKGQPRGLTGRLQSIQWCAMYVATILAGLIGGFLSQHARQELGFLICACVTLITLGLAWFYVKEEPSRMRKASFRTAVMALAKVARSPAVVAAAAFVFLWSFNPFSTSVLYLHTTVTLGLSEQYYGASVSLLAVGAIVASVAYGAYCRHVPFPWLIHGSILAGILSTLAYWGFTGMMSGVTINIFVGFSYMTGSLVLFDLSARACPLDVAGTTFALLMGLTNLSMALSAAVGSWLYECWADHWGATAAFNLLVLAGALANCACWLVVPFLKKVP